MRAVPLRILPRRVRIEHIQVIGQLRSFLKQHPMDIGAAAVRNCLGNLRHEVMHNLRLLRDGQIGHPLLRTALAGFFVLSILLLWSALTSFLLLCSVLLPAVFL